MLVGFLERGNLVEGGSQSPLVLLGHICQPHVLPHELDEGGSLEQAAQPLEVTLCKEGRAQRNRAGQGRGGSRTQPQTVQPG